MIQLIIALMALHPPAPADSVVDYPTDWTVTVTENEVPRTMRAVDPSDLRFSFTVDQKLAPGWGCRVEPEQWRANSRSRWATCEFHEGRASVSIRTDCRSDRQSEKSQEVWLGDHVSVKLACRSGISP